ncbi:MAG: TonB-dependent receptor, partial [Gammaproteobacteria bacterium]
MHSARAFRGSTPFIALLLGMPLVQAAPGQPIRLAEATDAPVETSLEEVVVTSRKRGEERLQDVPTAISAFGSETLEKMGVTDFKDFAYQVPGLTFNDTGPGEKRYILRGVQSAGQEQVAVYYDEIPAPGIQSSSGDSGSQTTDFQLYDMERIEVLKGPQGTTFGANSQTGAVRFIANKPDLKEVSGSVKLGANTMSHGDNGDSLYGSFNMPLITDKLGIRLVGYYDKNGGYIDNVRLKTNNINWSKTTGGRILMRYQPTESATLDAMVWSQKRDTGGASSYHPYDTFHLTGNTSDPAFKDRVPTYAFFDTGEFQDGDYVQTQRPDQQTMGSLTWTQNLSFATLTATGSIYKRDFGFFRDNTWSIISLNVGPAGATCLNGQPCLRPDLFPELTDQTQDITQKSAEIRLNSSGDGPFQYLAGFFYRDRDSGFRSVSPIVGADGKALPITTPPPGFSTAVGAGIDGCSPCALARFNTRTIKENAVFGEASYKLFEKFELMAGLRRFEAEQDDDGFYLFNFPLLPPIGALPPNDQRHFKEDRLIKKFQLSYRPMKDLTIFALASQGFRLGGTNQATVPTVPLGYEADSLWNYELGLKSSWFERRLTINTGVFVIDWSNIQVSGRDPSGAFAFIGNAGAARVEGLEFEVFAAPVRGLDLSAGFSVLPKKELTEDQVNSTVAAPGRKGDNLPRIPKWTADFSAQYTHGLPAFPEWAGWARVDWAYHGKSNTELRGPLVATNRIQRDYEITNLRIGTSNQEKGLDVAFYVSNIFDVQGDVFLIAATATPTVKYTNT